MPPTVQMDVKPIALEVVQTLALVVVEALLELKYYLLTKLYYYETFFIYNNVYCMSECNGQRLCHCV